MDHLPDNLIEVLIRRTPQLILADRRARRIATEESIQWDFQRVIECQWAAPRELNDLIMLQELRRVDHLVVRGWLVQSYRVLVGEQTFEDFLTGLKLLLPAGYELTQDDYDLLLSLVAYLDVAHGRGPEGRRILDLLATRHLIEGGVGVEIISPVIEAWIRELYDGSDSSTHSGSNPDYILGPKPPFQTYFVVHPTRWRDLWDIWLTNTDPPWANELVNQSSHLDELLAMGWQPRYWNLIMFHATEVIRTLLQRDPELVNELFSVLAHCLGEDWFALEMQAPIPLLTALALMVDYTDHLSPESRPPTAALRRLPPELRTRYLTRLGIASELEFKTVDQLQLVDRQMAGCQEHIWTSVFSCYNHSWDYYLQWRHVLHHERGSVPSITTDDKLLNRLLAMS